jgi:CheY-like chemotaxis protein
MSYKFHSIKVLLVEDSTPLRRLMTSILKTLGVVHIYHAKDGEEGYQKYLSENPDLILTDWRMANMDGIDLTQKIRMEKNSPNRFVPIIMVSGYSQMNDVLRARDAGINEFVVKPFTIDRLVKHLTRVIETDREFVVREDYIGPRWDHEEKTA